MGFLSTLKNGAKVALDICKEHSPEIAMAGGLICMGGAVACAIKATIGLKDAIDDYELEYDGIMYDLERGDISAEIADAEIKKAKSTLYKTGLLKFAGPFGMFLTGSSMIIWGHSERSRRWSKKCAAITASASAAIEKWQKAFETYRRRNIEKNGEENDRYCMYGIEQEQYTEVTVDENGKKHKEKKTRDVWNDPLGLNAAGSPYFLAIGPDTALWKEYRGNPIYIRDHLLRLQSMLNTSYFDKNPVWANQDIYAPILGYDWEQLKDFGQLAGYFIEDPENAAKCDGKIDLRIGSAYVHGEDGDWEMFYIDPNIPGEISLERARDARKARRSHRSGKYISM